MALESELIWVLQAEAESHRGLNLALSSKHYTLVCCASDPCLCLSLCKRSKQGQPDAHAGMQVWRNQPEYLGQLLEEGAAADAQDGESGW